MQALDNIRIVLVETSHPGNIGSAARAMKTMGLSHLVLVKPRLFPHADASAFAAGADDVLQNARICETLTEALADCRYVVGTTARRRTVAIEVGTPAEVMPVVYQQASTQKVAVVFGRERTGLFNDELDMCQQGAEIPANPEYSSLNLAAAVQVMSYELRKQALALETAPPEIEVRIDPPASTEQLENFYEHLQRVMINTGFLDRNKPRFLMRRLRRLFGRAQPDEREVNILRGILNSVENPFPPED